jgi:hypothetical protein
VLLGIKTIEDLTKKSDIILDYFLKLKRKSVGSKEREIALSPLSQSKIEIATKEISDGWKSGAFIHSLFKHYNNTELITDNNIDLRNIGTNMFFRNGKIYFIDGEHSLEFPGFDAFGKEIAKLEDNNFIHLINKSDHNKLEDSSIFKILDKSILQLRNNNTNPNIILIFPENHLIDELCKSNKITIFTPNLDQNSVLESFLFGTYDGIPIYKLQNSEFENKMLICDFDKAFKMSYNSNSNLFEKELLINISDISEKDAKSILNKRQGDWKITEDSIILTDEEAMIAIKNSVFLDIWLNLDFRIIDIDAYIIGYFTSDVTEV